ncbi:MAG: phosphate propanoyltransferase [Clostridia bacterium]|nr:phosphate propanoyltransferase [Clostridia bacterium]
MNEKELRAYVERVILSELAKIGEPYVPVMSSNRHCHLSQADVERLFGAGYRLSRMRDLVQPGQYACNERVTIETPKGKMTLRVVGPARKETQVELSVTDAVKLGLKPPIRMSGELEGSPGCVLSNGDRRIEIPRGVIVAARHLHLSTEEAQAYGLSDGDVVNLRVEGPRPCTLEGVLVRSGEAHRMEAHIDTDEANACALTNGQLCRVIRKEGNSTCAAANVGLAQALAGMLTGAAPMQKAAAVPERAPAKRETMLDVSDEAHRLITEDDVRRAALNGYKIIRYAQDAIVTPLARDTASDKGIELVTAIN